MPQTTTAGLLRKITGAMKERYIPVIMKKLDSRPDALTMGDEKNFRNKTTTIEVPMKPRIETVSIKAPTVLVYWIVFPRRATQESRSLLGISFGRQLTHVLLTTLALGAHFMHFQQQCRARTLSSLISPLTFWHGSLHTDLGTLFSLWLPQYIDLSNISSSPMKSLLVSALAQAP